MKAPEILTSRLVRLNFGANSGGGSGMGFLILSAAGGPDNSRCGLYTLATGSNCIKEAVLEWFNSYGGAMTGGRYRT